MPMLPISLRRLVTIVALAVAAAIAVAAPLGFLVFEFQSEESTLQFKARLDAGRDAQYVYAHPTMWQYHGLRLAEHLLLPGADSIHQRVVDALGKLVTEEGPDVASPVLHASAPIIVAGAEVGALQASTSLRPMLMDTLLVTALSWALA